MDLFYLFKMQQKTINRKSHTWTTFFFTISIQNKQQIEYMIIKTNSQTNNYYYNVLMRD